MPNAFYKNTFIYFFYTKGLILPTWLFWHQVLLTFGAKIRFGLAGYLSPLAARTQLRGEGRGPEDLMLVHFLNSLHGYIYTNTGVVRGGVPDLL
jgi:hypothetical protein